MSRFIRLYEKKRGHRRTGSKAMGNLGEALFFGTFLALGAWPWPRCSPSLCGPNGG